MTNKYATALKQRGPDGFAALIKFLPLAPSTLTPKLVQDFIDKPEVGMLNEDEMRFLEDVVRGKFAIDHVTGKPFRVAQTAKAHLLGVKADVSADERMRIAKAMNYTAGEGIAGFKQTAGKPIKPDTQADLDKRHAARVAADKEKEAQKPKAPVTVMQRVASLVVGAPS